MRNFVLLSLVFSFFFQSCGKDDTKIDYAVTKEDAKNLITTWIYNDYNPEMNPSLSFSVIEYTTDEIYVKLNGQVFGVISDVPGLTNRWLFIKDKRVYDLFPGNQYASGTDFNNLLVTDLNNDSEYELSFTAHAGSGILYQGINCFYFLNDSISHINSKVICRFPLDYQIYLQKESCQKLYIRFKDDENDLRIGEVKLLKREDGMELVIELYEDISPEIVDKLNGIR
ncbi:MAG: hypothetical protein MUO72_00270 [Bacteroidales bacterium]|nr:hypothetical protein [Bacteroidales bacterium]